MSKLQINMPPYKAKLPHSGFDMSQSLAFTASTGMILPVYSDFLNAGEKVSFKPSMFARTQPLVTPAMADVDFYIDWFFVPMTMLLTSWGQIRYQTNDFISSLYFEAATPDGVALSIGQGNFPVFEGNANPLFDNPSLVQLNNQSPMFYNGTAIVNLPETFESIGKSTYRLMDMLGFNPNQVFENFSVGGINQTGARFSNPNVFPWRALAYQCIYQWHFRNDDYEKLNVKSYNWDSRQFETDPQSFSGTIGTSEWPDNPFLLRYCDYRRDYFQTVKPSPLMSGINMLASNSSQTLLQINNFLSNGAVSTSNANGAFMQGVGSQVSSLATQQSIQLSSQNRLGSASLRSLFAVEKLIRVSGRTMKTYDSQVLAHFGFQIPHDVKHEITHLGSSSALLHIGEVVGTADTFNGDTGSALGELAGKGYVSIQQKKPRRFTAPVDGVFMATFRAVPRLRVQSTFDKQNSVANRLDLFIPAFDKLGMQPLYQYEFNYNKMLSSDTFGWQFRYAQWKQKYDRVTSVFSSYVNDGKSINQYSSWVLGYSPFSITIPGGASVNPAFFTSITAPMLKCSPCALNSIMTIPYVPTLSSNAGNNPALEFQTDPFICDFRAIVTKVSTMSPTGEPDMISL